MYLKLSALIVLTLCLAFLVRGLYLRHNGQKLTTISRTFPRDYYVGPEGSPTLLYAALGDSTVEGTGTSRVEDTLPYRIAAQISQKGYRVHVANLAVSGAKTHDLISNQLPALAALTPQVITLNIGANNATYFTSLKDYEHDLQLIITALTNTSAPTIVVATTPDLSITPALPPVYRYLTGRRAEAQNVILSRMAEENSLLQIIDLFSEGRLAKPNLYASDEFHPSADGYAEWAKLYANLALPQ